MPGACVAYYRVSTERQGNSGLGLDAQRSAIREYLRGGTWDLIGEYTEVESGKRANRPQLATALAECKARRATLIIAKLDRLARNVAFIANLMESGVEFVAADNPHASKLMLHMLAAFAEHEREQISARTKAALSAAKERGVKLGTYATTLAAKKRIEANENAMSYAQIIADIQAAGTVTVRGITAELNRRGILSISGRQWHVPTVHRLLRRLASAA
jgi:DNA invertase Pin-like site-specific DNA recombinase